MENNVEILKASADDLNLFKGLLTVFEETFEMVNFNIPDDKYLSTLLKNPTFMIYVVRSNKEVIGGLTAHILPSYYFTSAEVYVYDLAIRPAHQRKGFGKQLMFLLKKDCKAMGFKEVFVQADLVDTHALDFYHATGGIPENVVHFYYPL
ncbi:GNAT family N-acetyltransferase [Chryseolinea sp. H1M3-3]|uniref:GNAT family N-acetyltransferase n=1 Tax=Chryseolinea sp. H1M3-3 TaxID=3034144 RepID=UPI0023EC90F6|nr:GNAT family N-acetyltransferase [Chryseolinea sp. H1M3-3]